MSILKTQPESSAGEVREWGSARPGRVSLAVGILLLALAAVHCTLSIFFVNHSYLNLKAYAAGTEKMPYQGRIGMMPVLWLAEKSPAFVGFTAKVDRIMASHERRRLPEHHGGAIGEPVRGSVLATGVGRGGSSLAPVVLAKSRYPQTEEGYGL